MLLIYGSTGYTGRLIVAEALARGLRPTLAAAYGADVILEIPGVIRTDVA